MYVLVFLLYEGLYDCSLLISLCTIMSHLTFSCISLCHSFSYTQNGFTPLYLGSQNGHKQTVEVLLKNGANVNLTITVSYTEAINYPCKTKRTNSGIGALFRGGLLRVVTRYYARRGRVITRLSVNKRGRTPKYLHSRALFRTNVVVSVRSYARTSVC